MGRITGANLMIAAYPVQDVVVEGRVDRDGAAISHLEAHGYGVTATASDIVWPYRARQPTAGRLQVDSADLRPLLGALLPTVPRPPTPATLRFIATAAADGAARAEAQVTTTGATMSATAALVAGTLDAKLQATVDDLAGFAWLAALPSASGGSASLRFAYRGALARRGDGLPVGELTLALAGKALVVAGRRLGELTIDARMTDGRAHTAIASSGINGRFAADATASFAAGALALRVDQLGGSWRGIPWALAAPADLSISTQALRVAPTSLSVGDGTIAFAANFAQRWQATATLDRLPFATVAALAGLGQGAAGTLTGTLSVDGPAEGPDASIALRLVDGALAGRTAGLTLAAHQDASGLRLAVLDGEWGGVVRVRAGGSWPLVLGAHGPRATGGVPDLQATVTVPDLAAIVPGGRISGAATATLAAHSQAGALRARLAGTGRGLRMQSRDPDASPSEPLDVEVEATADSEGAAVALRVGHDATTVLRADLASPAPLAARDLFAAAAWLARPLQGEIVLSDLPLAPLEALAPAVLGLGGRIAGTLVVSGTPGHPTPDGTLTLAGGEVKLRGDLPRITATQGTLTLSGGLMTLDLAGELGYAPVTCRGRITRDGQGSPALDLRVEGRNVLLAQDRDLRLRADVDLGLGGPLAALMLSGTARITDALWSQRIDLLRASTPDADQRLQFFAIRQGPFAGMRLDLVLAADRTLRLANNLITADCSLDLRLGGTGAVPVPEGRLWTTDARLSLPFSSLRLDRAEVRFASDSPFRPSLEASGRTRMQGYELSAIATGPIDDVEVAVTATPPLEPEDAVLLLTTGTTRSGLEAGGERGALTRVGTYLGQELLRKAAGPGNPDEDGVLDKVTLAIGEQTSRSGVDTITAEVLLFPERRPPRQPKGLRLGEILLVGERDRFDAYNLDLVYRLRFR